MTAPDLRSDETKYWHAEIARAVAERDAEVARLRSYNEGLAKIQTGMEAEIERLRAALQDIATGGHSTLRSAIHRATIALDNEQAPQAYKWICESCGTLSNDQTCDCTKFGRPGRFVPFDGQAGK